MIKVKESYLERIQKQDNLPMRNYLIYAVVPDGPPAALTGSFCLCLKKLSCV